MYDCLSNVVKITKNEADCIDPNLAGESLSGLYVDDTTVGRIPLSPLFYKNSDKLSTLIPDAINQALNSIKVSVENQLISRYNNTHIRIGYRENMNDFLNTTDKDNRFMVIKSFGVRGTIFRLEKVDIFLKNGKFNGEIQITKHGEEDPLYAGLIGDFKPMTINLETMDLLFISYPEEDGNPPWNFKHKGCCGSVEPYSRYFKIGSGFNNNDELPVWTVSDYANGICLNGTLDCDGFYFICADTETPTIDFNKTTFGILVAKLIQQIARRNLGSWILTDDNLSPYKLVQSEELNAILLYLDQDIEKMLNYIPNTYHFSDCYTCVGPVKKFIRI